MAAHSSGRLHLYLVIPSDLKQLKNGVLAASASVHRHIGIGDACGGLTTAVLLPRFVERLRKRRFCEHSGDNVVVVSAVSAHENGIVRIYTFSTTIEEGILASSVRLSSVGAFFRKGRLRPASVVLSLAPLCGCVVASIKDLEGKDGDSSALRVFNVEAAEEQYEQNGTNISIIGDELERDVIKDKERTHVVVDLEECRIFPTRNDTMVQTMENVEDQEMPIACWGPVTLYHNNSHSNGTCSSVLAMFHERSCSLQIITGHLRCTIAHGYEMSWYLRHPFSNVPIPRCFIGMGTTVMMGGGDIWCASRGGTAYLFRHEETDGNESPTVVVSTCSRPMSLTERTRAVVPYAHFFLAGTVQVSMLNDDDSGDMKATMVQKDILIYTWDRGRVEIFCVSPLLPSFFQQTLTTMSTSMSSGERALLEALNNNGTLNLVMHQYNLTSKERKIKESTENAILHALLKTAAGDDSAIDMLLLKQQERC
eukprot:CAMPEP_0113299338 /NCGR_PEP_ID=MMETSP0010_2-20120614/1414_1 /TAXON_ID=216773 ORGANISM="Corethron hystrix, Strain 308" /NCGR_SAMPLE_ID=MMETSP0010_2 /ASSEMBLY_ACC=CAM_ASM_000155 /LENGTH=480 /DNA_ID=CAMNT_0000152555 /DNA_START=513 /DNA_END=1955 /DNA_ORIENTATION=- /assembly_acc=CAM_ASM_000155